MAERRTNLTSGKTGAGAEIRILTKYLVRSIRRNWPRTRVTCRGDAHYRRIQAIRVVRVQRC